MPRFSYVAINSSGKEVKGAMDAGDAAAVEHMLKDQELMPISVSAGESSSGEQKSSGLNSSGKGGKPRKITVRDVIDFTKQLVTLIKAGVPILSSLETLAGQADNPNFAETLIHVAEDIASGKDFSDALAKHPKVFDYLYINAVKAGETGGVLDVVLVRLGDVLKRDAEIKQKVKGALRYPITVVIFMGIAFLVLVTMVVPKFAAIFNQVGLELPLPTIFLMFIANMVLGYWWLMIAVTAGLIIGFRLLIATKGGRYWFDGFILKVPIFGTLILKTAMTRFTSMFETLSRAGLPILQIFQIVSDAVGNVVLGQGLKQAAEGIEFGRGIAVSLAETGLFPPLVVKMISVGEDSGAIDDMLTNISEYYEEEVKQAVEGLTSMIEPILTVGMGLMVLLLALAIFLPMWDMTQMAQH
ncbi:MAG: type II secretion system F family protein [Calditrichaeota bacterium]|nr:type II secretion system F family protein [Calditrichota bacterium]